MLFGLSLLLVFQAKATPDYPAYAVPQMEGVTVPGLPAVTSRIHVDQFGYLPGSVKVAVISDPQKGYNAGDAFAPGATLEVRNRKSGKAVAKGAAKLWKNGAVHEDSGDRGWWFDFSALRTPGEYYVYDPKSKLRSAVFLVGENCFAPVLKAATRMFYYQRLGVDLVAPYAEAPWFEKAALKQDSRARSVLAKDDASTARDLSGGWMDAGDTNKYPPFNGEVIHPLLHAYRSNPKIFGDGNGIPESGNGLPDLLDELKVQLDWLVRMQFPDGALPVKMGNIDYNGKYPLHLDERPRYYGPKDSGAAIYASSFFAHASRVYGRFPKWKPFAEDLRRRAILSWNWYKANPRTYRSDNGEIKSGNASRGPEDQDQMEAVAAIHLYALTGLEKYHEAAKAKVGAFRQLKEPTWSPYGAAAGGEALLDYLQLPKADPALKARIRGQLKRSASNVNWAPPADADLYRSWMVPTSYHWGSSAVRANYGLICLQAAAQGGLSPAEKKRMRDRAADMLHSFHGVNPLTVVYLSNMKRYGAELSSMRIYHERYNPATPHASNPAPGYVVGGPNQSYSGKSDAGTPSVDWIKAQPRAKAYAEMNKVWPEASWELSEPAIYYQAMYIRLLSEFVGKKS